VEKINDDKTINSYDLPQNLIKKYKIGIYRELHAKGLLTKKQLDTLINLQDVKGHYPMEN